MALTAIQCRGVKAQKTIDEKGVALESLTAIKRAGAGIILTYWAKDVAAWLG